jgi:hypothetical protein
MTKFALIIWVCSFAANPTACLPPMEFPMHFDSWYECSRAAHKESLGMISKMGYKYVNENKIAMSYTCRQVSDL